MINNCGCPEVWKGIWTVAKTYLDGFAEVVLRTETPNTFDDVYVDNSMTV